MAGGLKCVSRVVTNQKFMRSIFIKAACIAAILSSPLIACSQHYYVVVGAFAADENASEVKGSVPVEIADSTFTVSKPENVLQFYLLRTSDKETAISRSIQLRKAIEGWNDSAPSAGDGQTATVPVTPLAIDDPASASASSASGTANAGFVPMKPVGKYFKFRIESPEGNTLPGLVHHVDFEEGRELGAYETDTFVDLLRPGQTSEPMAIVCGVFGYKEVEKYIDYANPSSTDKQAYIDEQGAWVIPYKLERVEAGDVSVMYNVSFYKDAAIMRKPSQTDLDELVRMMHKNPYYEITVHAHCNGKNKREVIAFGPEKNYFDVAGSVELTASARQLTTLRAEAIRSYLVDHGIDSRRIKVFSWGGSDMLVKANHPHASLNDRIEIEFTRD